MVPVMLRTHGATPPAGPLHYAVTADGIFEVRDTDLYRSETKAMVVLPGLERGRESLEIRMPPLAADVLASATAFFATVNRLCGSEGVLILFYDPRTRRYRAGAPTQTIKAHASSHGRYLTSLAVSYGAVARPAGHLRCGSIHSHADLPAYASHTDCNDELDEDGLHVVIGDFEKPRLSLSAAFTVAGRRFAVDTRDVLAPFDVVAACKQAPPRDWLAASTLEFIDGAEPRRYLPLDQALELRDRRVPFYDVSTLAERARPRAETRS